MFEDEWGVKMSCSVSDFIVTLECDSLCGRSTATLLIISTYYVTENL